MSKFFIPIALIISLFITGCALQEAADSTSNESSDSKLNQDSNRFNNCTIDLPNNSINRAITGVEVNKADFAAIEQAQSQLQTLKEAPQLFVESKQTQYETFDRARFLSAEADAEAEASQPARLPNNPRGTLSDSLSSASDLKLYLFDTDADKFMIGRLLSDNKDLQIQLYIVDAAKGTAQPTNIIKKSGELISLNGLPKGAYAFAVRTTGSHTGTYTLQLNITNPAAKYDKILSVTTDLQQFSIRYEDGKVYGNGEFIYNVNTPKKLDWKRVYYFSYGGNYNQRTHSISHATVKSVIGPVSYTAQYAKSKRAMLLYLDVGTLFMYHRSAYTSNPPQYVKSFYDTLDRKTPRRLDAEDFIKNREHILVYDVASSKPIDFFSILNYYYAAGVEDLPSISPIQ